MDNIMRYLVPALWIALGVMLVSCICILIMRLLQWQRVLRSDSILLELTPPASTARSPVATSELFNVIHGLRSTRTIADKLLMRNIVMAFEIVSTRDAGIRYLVRVDKHHAKTVVHAIHAYLPDMKVQEISEYIPSKPIKVLEFKQTGHYAFPLAATGSLEHHDPVAYLAGALTQLDQGEQIRLQIVIAPVQLKEASLLAHKILGNEDLLSHLSSKKLPLASQLTRFLNTGLFAAIDTIGEIHHGQTKKSAYDGSYGSARASYEKLQVSTRQRPARTLSAFELELMETIHSKLQRPLFRVSIRAAIYTNTLGEAKHRVSAIKSSLQAYSVPSYQSLKVRLNAPLSSSLRDYTFAHGLPNFSPRSGLVLSSSELGGLYHFPLGNNAQTDNLITSLSKSLPAPVSLKQRTKLDVIIGENNHHGTKTLIGLTEKERERHMYIIGGTGNGKTTMLQYQIVQDMENGKGLAVIDPHGDMAETLLRHVPESRIKDIVYFNPDDLEYPIGLNLLELTPGLSGNALIHEKDIITESVVSVFRKIFSDEDTGGHRIEYVLRCTIQTALTIPDATLFTVFDLLNDPTFRKSVVKTLTDKNLINFWKNELGKAGDMQKVKMAAGITAKIGRFLFSASARQILEQPKSTIHFDEIINSGKILICNFSKGLLGEDTSELFGITVLAKLQLASLRRARIEQTKRRPFYVYVDEFQNFATQSFVQLLSESRKYKLMMIMAEQSTSQQDDQQMVNVILANVGTVICFRTGNPQDERSLLPLFAPYVEPGEISNLPAFNYYIRLSAITAQEPASGQTLLLSDAGSKETAVEAIKHSRRLFARKQKPQEDPQPIKTTAKTTRRSETTSPKNPKQTVVLFDSP